MKRLLKSASYVFHPLWMPFAGTLFYFLVSPRFFPLPIIKAKLLAVAIMTIFIPVVFFFMLKTLEKVSDHYLREVKERRWPLLFYAALSFVIMKFVLDSFDFPELYFFFLGIFTSALMALFFVMTNHQISLHMMGLGGLLCFVLLLSLHFNLNMIYTISFLIAITGLTASSRLLYNAHNHKELGIGLLLGIIPQVVISFYWI